MTNNSFIVSAVLKSYDLPESGDEYVMLSVVSSFMARRIVSALQVLSLGCRERWGMR
ncbi:UNVERIFIED_ORG: hypothetical protein QOE_2317 [Clostridioides difficile F501]